MTLLLDTSLWIDFTRTRGPVALKQCIAPYVLDPAAHASGSVAASDQPWPGLPPDRPHRPQP